MRGYWIVVLVLLMGTVANCQQKIDIRDWLGDEPLTLQRAVEDLVDYFSQRDPHGIPVLQVPDTIQIPGRLGLSQITLFDALISGHSELRLEYVNVNITSLSATARLSLPNVNVYGAYEWPGYWGSSQGDANITILGIQVTTDLFLGVSTEGILKVNNLQIDFAYDDLLLDFTGLSYTHSLVVSAASTFFSTIIQPIVVGTAQTKIMSRLNERLEQRLGNTPFPDSISPADYAIVKIRNEIRKRNLDPFMPPTVDANLAWGVTVQLKDVEVVGISTFYRTHEVSAQFIDNAVYITIQIGTQKLSGGADWSLSAALLPAVGGHMDLEIDGLAVTVEAKQPANIRSPPTLRKIDVQLGNIAVRSAGDGTLDYAVEMAVNILPNALRNVIMDRLEPRIHQVIQDKLNRQDIYRTVMDKVAERGDTVLLQ